MWKTTASGKVKSGKRFPSPVKDHALWPVVNKDLTKSRLGVREVKLDENKVMLKNGVVDGINVRKTYRLVNYDNVTDLMFRIDGL